MTDDGALDAQHLGAQELGQVTTPTCHECTPISVPHRNRLSRWTRRWIHSRGCSREGKTIERTPDHRPRIDPRND